MDPDPFFRLPSDEVREIVWRAAMQIDTTAAGERVVQFRDGATYRETSTGAMVLCTSRQMKGNPKGKAARKRWRADRQRLIARRRQSLGI